MDANAWWAAFVALALVSGATWWVLRR